MQFGVDVTLIFDDDIATYRYNILKFFKSIGLEVLDNGCNRPDGKIIVRMHQKGE